MSYRQSLRPDNRHLGSLCDNIQLRGVTYATSIPVTGAPVTDYDRKQSDYVHFPLPIITMYTSLSSGQYEYPVSTTIHSFYNLDEIYYRIDDDNYQIYHGEEITIEYPCKLEYFGIRLNELITQTQFTTFSEMTYITIPLTVEPQSGTYDNSLVISATYNNNSNVYYTTDGFEPNQYSTLYTGPFTPDTFGTYRFIAIDSEQSNKRSVIVNRYYHSLV